MWPARGEVTIDRNGKNAVIRYAEPGILPLSLHVGPQLSAMTDDRVLAFYDDWLRETSKAAANYRHIAVETPLGSS